MPKFTSLNRLHCFFGSFTGKGGPQKILEGVRVLDLSRILAGPMATMQLSDLGAEVIKVESFEGDETRKWGPPFAKGSTDSSYYLSTNRNKKSICINLKTKEGQQLVRSLTLKSDVICENFSRGVMKRLNLDYETLQQTNPKLIYASISGYGEDGPIAHQPAFDLIMQARSGFMHVTGQSDSLPTKVGFAITDVLTGLFLANGILAALHHRQLTGRGMQVNTSLQESAIASLVNVSTQYLNGGYQHRRMGNQHPSIVPYGVYPTKNGEYIVVGAATNEQFNRFCNLIEAQHLSADERFKSNSDRVRNRQAFDELLIMALKDFDASQLSKQMNSANIPGGLIMDIPQLFDDEQVKHLKMVESVPSNNYENLRLVRNPLNFSEDVKAPMEEPPSLNENCDEILKKILGLQPEEIEVLKQKNAIK